MEKDLAEGKIGSVGAYDLEFKGGKLTFKLSAGASGLSAMVGIEADADVVLDALAKAIPGHVDDALLGLMKSALKA